MAMEIFLIFNNRAMHKFFQKGSSNNTLPSKWYDTFFAPATSVQGK